MQVAASQPHYVRHLAPIARAMGAGLVPLGPEAGRAALAAGVPLEPFAGGPVLVAGWVDSLRFPQVALMEHGAGQTYLDARHPCYAGGKGRDHISLFLCQTPDIAERNGSGEVIGYPALDGVRIPVERGRIGFTWHWDCAISPEAGTAWHEYAAALPAALARLTAAGWTVVGHAHPRIAHLVRPWWESIGVRWVDYRELLACEVVVCDNSTAGCEAMWLRRRVIWLSATHWRRDVEHGRRFWEWPRVCHHIASPRDIGALPELAALDYDREAARRVAERALGEVTGAVARAVKSLWAWASTRPHRGF
ncbi:MAG: hypothetical protein KatS3mg014_2542 [Actinomycetota bacterium]|nr:MAG: hypothetical protein KatS3mg014_2463 [Actinomycetota bacterium]GIV00927.1 MAG: hypothetical protein KatS3mg014_2542 [Actinomycetota bacterium]